MLNDSETKMVRIYVPGWLRGHDLYVFVVVYDWGL
jgi:hypothetical protein